MSSEKVTLSRALAFSLPRAHRNDVRCRVLPVDVNLSPTKSVDLVLSRRDVVAPEDARGLVAGDVHRHRLVHATPDEVADGGSPEVVEELGREARSAASLPPALVEVEPGHPEAVENVG